MEDLQFDCDENLCLDSIFKLKAIVEIASHEVTRISYVTMDPTDPRAFGYIYNTSDGRHQFWAIKTERPALVTVLAYKDLFDTVLEQFKNLEKTKIQANQTTSTSAFPETSTVIIQQSSSLSTPQSILQPPVISAESIPQLTQAPQTPLFNNIWGDSPSTTVSQTISVPKTPLFDDPWGDNSSTTVLRTTSTLKTPLFDDVWGNTPSTTVPRPLQTAQQLSTPSIDPWNISESVIPIIQPPCRVENPLANVFNVHASPSAVTKTTQQSGSTVGTSDLFSMFTTTAPTHTFNTNMFDQQTQHTPFVSQQQPNFPDLTSLAPFTSPIATSPSGDFSSKSTAAKTMLFSSIPTS
ncbi:unnamed protein product [Rotaria sp. Silwood2]|nr:unnamed protein product [Rotaria sp. Silwood2]